MIGVARSTEGELQLPASHGKHIGERDSISLKHEQHWLVTPLRQGPYQDKSQVLRVLPRQPLAHLFCGYNFYQSTGELLGQRHGGARLVRRPLYSPHSNHPTLTEQG